MPKFNKKHAVAQALLKGVAIDVIKKKYQTNTEYVKQVQRDVNKGMYSHLA